MGAELVRGQLTVVAVAQRGDFILSLIHIHLTDKRLQRAADPFAAERKQRRCFGRRHRYRLALRGYGKGRRCKHLQAVLRRGGVNEKMLLLRLCQRHRRHYLTRLVRSRIGFRSGVGLCRNKACRIRADAVCIRGNAAFFIVRMAARLCFVKRVVAAPPEAHGRFLRRIHDGDPSEALCSARANRLDGRGGHNAHGTRRNQQQQRQQDGNRSV